MVACLHVNVWLRSWVSLSVPWCSGRAVQTVECLVTWRSHSTAVLAAFRTRDPEKLGNCDTAHTQTLTMDTPSKAQP